MLGVLKKTVLHTKYNKVSGKYAENIIHFANELQKLLIHLDIYMTVLLEYIGDCSIRVNQSNGPHSL